jgi:hypothetical protein
MHTMDYVLVFIISAQYAPSMAALDARSDDEADASPVEEGRRGSSVEASLASAATHLSPRPSLSGESVPL